jgi:hypothetical protein
MKIKNILVYIFLFLLTALALDLANPLFDRPARDGGFFLYAGGQILDGKIPYQDFWDSKGPAIFYVNALGLFLGNGSRWGVWLVEFIFIFFTFFVLYRTLLNKWGISAALFGVAVSGLSLKVSLGYGNYTEEYALLFNAIALYLFLSMNYGVEQLAPPVSDKNNWKYVWIGALFGLSFNFRANNIGGLFAILIAVFLFYTFKQSLIESIKIVGATLAGFIASLLFWVLYFTILGLANEMVYASILFNFSYSAAQERTWLDLFGGFGRYGIGWYGWLTLFAWLILSIQIFTRFIKKQLLPLDIFLLFWFPIEIFLSNLSGRNFTHYYISWVLAIAIYSGFIFYEFQQFVLKTLSKSNWFDSVVIGIAIIGLLILSPSSWARYIETVLADEKEYVDPISAYIQENTQADDLVLTWYPEMRINFMSGRASPVKYVYYPLFLEGSLTEEIENTFIEDLTSHRPMLILDCARQVDAIPSLDPATREEQFATSGVKRKMYIQPQMETIFAFVADNYHIETKMEDCIIFRLNSK